MAVPLMRNAFAENRPDLFVVLSKRSENVLFRFFLQKTTNRYNFRKIFAVLSVILRLQKRGTEFLGNNHHHYHHHHHHCHHHHHHHCIMWPIPFERVSSTSTSFSSTFYFLPPTCKNMRTVPSYYLKLQSNTCMTVLSSPAIKPRLDRLQR